MVINGTYLRIKIKKRTKLLSSYHDTKENGHVSWRYTKFLYPPLSCLLNYINKVNRDTGSISMY